jgi:hypothetical protein
MQDSAATLALLHRPGEPAGPWYDDWRAISELAQVLGTWMTVSRYLGTGVIGEYTSPAKADEFTTDALEPRCKANLALLLRSVHSPPINACDVESTVLARMLHCIAPLAAAAMPNCTIN